MPYINVKLCCLAALLLIVLAAAYRQYGQMSRPPTPQEQRVVNQAMSNWGQTLKEH